MIDHRTDELTQTPSSGPPLWIGLRSAAEELPPGRDREELLKISRLLERGESLDVLNTGSSPSPLVMAIQAGMDGHRLAQFLKIYLGADQEIRELWRRIWLNLMYPTLMATALFTLLSLFILFNIQTYKNIFYDFGVELPWITQVLIVVGDFWYHWWPFMLVCIVSLLILLCFLYSTRTRAATMRFVHGIPLLGRATWMTGLAELTELLALYIDANIPLPQAARALSRTLHNGSIRVAMKDLADRIESGQSVADAARQFKNWPVELIRVFEMPESEDAIAEGLRIQSQVFAARAGANLAQFRFAIEPTIFLMIFISAFLIVTALFFPQVRLLNDLS